MIRHGASHPHRATAEESNDRRPRGGASRHFEGLVAPHDSRARDPPFSHPPPEIEPGAGDHELPVLRRADIDAAAEIFALKADHGPMVTG